MRYKQQKNVNYQFAFKFFPCKAVAPQNQEICPFNMLVIVLKSAPSPACNVFSQVLCSVWLDTDFKKYYGYWKVTIF